MSVVFHDFFVGDRFLRGSPNMASTSGKKVNVPGKLDMQLLISSTKDHSAITQGTTKEFVARYGDGRPVHGEDERRTSTDVIYGDEDACRTKVIDVRAGKHDACWKHLDLSGCEEDRRSATMDHSREIMLSDDEEEFLDVTMERKGQWLFSDDEEDESSDAQMHPCYPIDDVMTMLILPKSRHRDDSIYRGTHTWKIYYHIEDVMRVAKLHVDGGSVELYGYIAVRDDLDLLLNYIVDISRDDPIIVEQDSLINMAGPKQGIDFCGVNLIEYDMRIKTGEQEKDDLQLIDGVSSTNGLIARNCYVFTNRIYGDRGAIDLTASCLQRAVEATVEVLISEVQSSFNLCLRCFTGGLKEEIRLFDGTIGEPRGLKRSVVAVVIGSTMDLKFKVGAESFGSAEHCCSFKVDKHGRATREIKTDFGLISVNVAWSTLPLGQ